MVRTKGEFKRLSRGDDQRFWISGLAFTHGIGLGHQGVFPWRDALDVKGTVFLNPAGTAPAAAARVLADHCAEVKIVERDLLMDTPDFRHGIPMDGRIHYPLQLP